MEVEEDEVDVKEEDRVGRKVGGCSEKGEESKFDFSLFLMGFSKKLRGGRKKFP